MLLRASLVSNTGIKVATEGDICLTEYARCYFLSKLAFVGTVELIQA